METCSCRKTGNSVATAPEHMDFTTVVAAKKVPIKELEKYTNGMLEITEEERELGFKHVFQTRITKATTGERIRSPMGMFSREETYIDNDAAKLLQHLNSFYNED